MQDNFVYACIQYSRKEGYRPGKAPALFLSYEPAKQWAVEKSWIFDHRPGCETWHMIPRVCVEEYYVTILKVALGVWTNICDPKLDDTHDTEVVETVYNPMTLAAIVIQRKWRAIK
jgi:hypothetical protein